MPAAVNEATSQPSDLVFTMVKLPEGKVLDMLSALAKTAFMSVVPGKFNLAPGKVAVESTAATLITPQALPGEPAM